VDRIKRLSTEILKEYEGKFGTDFSENKNYLNEISIIRSKGLKNEIAGYITKILQRKQKFEERKQQLIDSERKESEKNYSKQNTRVSEKTSELKEQSDIPNNESISEDEHPIIDESVKPEEEAIGEEIINDPDSEEKS
jgi:small subunit ribosomal protein S17e